MRSNLIFINDDILVQKLVEDILRDFKVHISINLKLTTKPFYDEALEIY